MARSEILPCAPTPVKQHKIDWAHLVTIDFETYFDTDYSLRKMSTSEYVRDPRFKAHMMGVKIGNKKTQVIPTGRIKSFLRTVDWSRHDLLCHNAAFDGFILSHHFGVVPRFYYDTLSMARGLHSNDIGAGLDEVARYYNVGNKVPDVLEQTKGVFNITGQLYKDAAAYCATDVDLTLEILKKMHPAFPDTEFGLVHLTIKMFADPVLKVDMPRVQAELERETRAKETLLSSIVEDNDDYDDKELLKNKAERALEGMERTMLIAKRIIGSSEKFAKLLRDEGVEPGTKISPAWMAKKAADRSDEDKYSYAFAKDDSFMQDLLESPVDRLRELAEARVSVKSTTNITRAGRFLEAGKNDWSLPVGLAYARAHTLRWGGNNKMNMQNLKRKGELRLSILAPKGYQIVVADSGQIEARVNGWLWGQTDLLESFRAADKWKKSMGVARGKDRDAYCKFGDIVYGREITTEDTLERFIGKVCVLGLGFQMGAAKLQSTLAKGALGGERVFFELDQCKEIVMKYRRVNNKIAMGWVKCAGIIEDMAAGREGSHGPLQWDGDGIWLPNGMCLRYPKLKKSKNDDTGFDEWSYQVKDGRSKIYGGLLCENIVQCLARLIVAEQMLEISKKYRIVMMTHDENVAIAPTRSAAKCYTDMEKAMRTAPTWCSDIPLNCEGGYAANYSK